MIGHSPFFKCLWDFTHHSGANINRQIAFERVKVSFPFADFVEILKGFERLVPITIHVRRYQMYKVLQTMRQLFQRFRKKRDLHRRPKHAIRVPRESIASPSGSRSDSHHRASRTICWGRVALAFSSTDLRPDALDTCQSTRPNSFYSGAETSTKLKNKKCVIDYIYKEKIATGNDYSRIHQRLITTSGF